MSNQLSVMRAVTLAEFGGPEKLVCQEVPEPVPEPGEAVIAVVVATVTGGDTHIRAGEARRPALPAILGEGVAGVVAATGADVDESLLGTRVIIATGGLGGYAEQVAGPAADLIPVPPDLPLADAAALLIDGRDALGWFRAAPPVSGEWVLIAFTGGGVGSLLVRLCTARGARVVAATGGPGELVLAGESGAEVLVDHTRPDWADAVRVATGGLDLVFDGVGAEVGRAALGLLRDGGRYCTNGKTPAPEPIDAERLTLLGPDSLPADPRRQRVLAATALTEAAEGRLRPTIGQTFPLDRAADAHTAIETGHTVGSTLLVP
jgi:NADPH2:quinone reductase